MNKKLIALAVAGACTLPMAAMADSGNVKISGYLNVSVDSLDGCETTACTATKRNLNVSSNSSNIVFSGDESLGNGLKAIWQLQTFIGMGNTGNGGTEEDAWTNGNSIVGLEGNFGKIYAGKYDTPMKTVGTKVDLFRNSIGDNRNMTNDAGFDLRESNVVAYSTPTVNGLRGEVMYISNMGASSNTNTMAYENTADAWSAAAMYENGPLMLAAAYEKHNLNDLGTGLEDEKSWRVVGGYSFGDAKVVALYQDQKDRDGANNSDRKVWGLGGAYKVGVHTFKLQYYKADEVDNATTEDGADMWAIGLEHALSKRTSLYAVYARVNNDDGASMTPFGGGHGDNPGTFNGEDASGFSLGMVHTF